MFSHRCRTDPLNFRCSFNIIPSNKHSAALKGLKFSQRSRAWRVRQQQYIPKCSAGGGPAAAFCFGAAVSRWKFPAGVWGKGRSPPRPARGDTGDELREGTQTPSRRVAGSDGSPFPSRSKRGSSYGSAGGCDTRRQTRRPSTFRRAAAYPPLIYIYLYLIFYIIFNFLTGLP